MPRVTVIGTGYLGLTHAVCLADLGHEVLAIDVDAEKIAMAANGEAPFFEPGLEPLLRKNLDAGRLRFTMSFAEVGAFGEVHFLCVGTPEGESGRADLGSVYAAAEALAPHLSVAVPGRGEVDRPGRDGAAGDDPDARDRAGRRRGRPGLEPGVPAGGVRGAGQPGPRPHRARRDLRAGRGDAARRCTAGRSRRAARCW